VTRMVSVRLSQEMLDWVDQKAKELNEASGNNPGYNRSTIIKIALDRLKQSEELDDERDRLIFLRKIKKVIR
jgi:hypothetical protein